MSIDGKICVLLNQWHLTILNHMSHLSILFDRINYYALSNYFFELFENETA
jgi:hypothetical protein